MPARNTIKIYASEQYYHVYNRGANKQTVFHEASDYQYFFYLLKRHLSNKPAFDSHGREYRHLREKIEIVVFCLMPNHFHILLYTHTETGMELLMRSLITAYSMYYNKKYEHSGHVFQGAYKASLIDSDKYLQHISRYIHLNPKDYKNYPYSSYFHSVKKFNTEWIGNKLFTDVFQGTIQDYENFVADYSDYNKTLKLFSTELADS